MWWKKPYINRRDWFDNLGALSLSQTSRFVDG